MEVSSDSETEQQSNSKAPKNKTQMDEKLRVKVKQKEKTACCMGKTKEKKDGRARTVIQNKKMVNPLAAFGDEPVKQSQVNKHKGTELNIHGDEDFDKTLLELDEEQLLKQCVNTTTTLAKSPGKQSEEKHTAPILCLPPPPVSALVVERKPVSSSTPNKHKAENDSKTYECCTLYIGNNYNVIYIRV